MRVTFKVWRQAGPKARGEFRRYTIEANEHMSFLEAIDVVNEQIIRDLEKHPEGPIAFDHDCREGICGACSMVIDGQPHGPWKATTTCQLHMRAYRDGAEITVEPWRARAFPIIKDLVVDRGAFDRIQQRGGYIVFDRARRRVDGQAERRKVAGGRKLPCRRFPPTEDGERGDGRRHCREVVGEPLLPRQLRIDPRSELLRRRVESSWRSGWRP